ncbi:MAG: hypothetical protein WC093_05075 [Methanoculleus sp.]
MSGGGVHLKGAAGEDNNGGNLLSCNGSPGATASTADPANGTTTAINLTGEVIRETDLVVRDARLVAAGP